MQDNEKYQVLSTKVSNHTYRRLNKLARRKGMAIYEIVQMVCDTLVRYMDDRHNLTEEMEQAMAVFEHLEGWRDALNLADPNVTKIVGEATYFLFDEAGKRHGCRAVHVTKPFFGQWTQEANIQRILERTICLLMPERYRRLRMLAIDMECNTVLELIDRMIDQHSKDADVAAIRQEFEDADRSDWGIKPKTDGPYKRVHSKQLNFVDESEQARQWLEANMGFRPHGGEW